MKQLWWCAPGKPDGRTGAHSEIRTDPGKPDGRTGDHSETKCQLWKPDGRSSFSLYKEEASL